MIIIIIINKIYVCDLIKTVKLICRDKLLVFDAVMRVEPWIEGIRLAERLPVFCLVNFRLHSDY